MKGDFGEGICVVVQEALLVLDENVLRGVVVELLDVVVFVFVQDELHGVSVDGQFESSLDETIYVFVGNDVREDVQGKNQQEEEQQKDEKGYASSPHSLTSLKGSLVLYVVQSRRGNRSLHILQFELLEEVQSCVSRRVVQKQLQFSHKRKVLIDVKLDLFTNGFVVHVLEVFHSRITLFDLENRDQSVHRCEQEEKLQRPVGLVVIAGGDMRTGSSVVDLEVFVTEKLVFVGVFAFEAMRSHWEEYKD